MEAKIETLGLGYTFDTANKKVIIVGARKYVKIRPTLIFNVTRSKILWNHPESGNIKRVNNDIEVYFPNADLTGHAAADTLMIFIDADFQELNVSSVRSLVATEVYDVTPSDSDDLAAGLGYVMVLGNAGDVAVITAAGNSVTLPLDKKEILPILVKRIKATSTTATNIKLIR